MTQRSKCGTLGALILGLVFLPAQVHGQAPTASTAADTARPHFRGSWTSDRREFSVGDVITVLVDESTLATANKGQTGSDQQTRDLGLTVPVGPTSGNPLAISTSKNATSTQNGQASRNLSFKGTMTVRVTRVDPSGVLEVKGSRTVDVDKNKQNLTLTGFVRPQDIARDNTVPSSRMGDAQLVYLLSGDMGATRGGIIGRLASVFWP